jgi:hypothetical protein
MVKVYRFQYVQRGTQLESKDYATEKAIREMGATLIPETEQEVDDGRVGFSGLLKQDTD